MLSLGWNGRQLQSIENGDYSVVYSYNTDEQRVRKVISTSDNSMTYTYEYFYNGSILAGQKLTKLEDGVEKVYTLAFMYDNNGDAFGFICNGEPYYYIKNAQNDVVLITDADGQAVVLYQYDAWGKITQCFDGTEEEISLINPLFYRSYYLDLEMEMYYLNSRYYLPMFHRFLNADGYVQTGQGILGCNMFAYCQNNPISRTDSSGTSFIAAIAVGAIVGGIIGAAAGAIKAARDGQSVAAGALTGGLAGAAIGAVCVAAPGYIGVLGTSLLCGVISAVGDIANQYRNYKDNQKNNRDIQKNGTARRTSSQGSQSGNNSRDNRFKVDKKSVIISFVSTTVASSVAIHVSALVAPAANELAATGVDLVARGIIEGSTGGNVSLLQLVFDIIVKEFEED